MLSVDEAVEMVRAGMPLGLHPLIGGLPPEIAWPYLKTVTEQVVPRCPDQIVNHPSEVTPRHGPSGHTLAEAAPRGERRGGPPCA